MMELVLLEINEKSLHSPSQQPYFLPQAPPSPPHNGGFNLNSKLVSPSILLIFIILTIIFFISGLLHLLVRFLLRPTNRVPDEMDNATALQGQLQQLFHLHDAGVDQSFIDTLPVFNYKAIIGLKNPFDCAVCLCEFEAEDKLRLLPKCSHAFHMECIDTWLLSHSTCPLCRASLLPDCSSNNSCSPIVFVLESGGESSREIDLDRESTALGLGASNSFARVSSHLVSQHDDENMLPNSGNLQKSGEIQVKEDDGAQTVVASREKVVQVKLGKLRNIDGGGGDSSNTENADARRCFSMGSLAYVVDENSSLQVPIRTPSRKQSSKKSSLPLTPGHRPAMSECGSDSRRELTGLDAFKFLDIQGDGNSSIAHNHNQNKATVGSKRESSSVSKVWLRGKKADKPNSAAEEVSRRAFSFRFPVNRNAMAGEEVKIKNCGGVVGRRTISEIDISRWENGRREHINCDEDIQSCSSFVSQANPSSFARRTFIWLKGKPSKVVHSSFPSNV